MPRKLKIMRPPKRNTTETPRAVKVACVMSECLSLRFILSVNEIKIGTTPKTSIATKSEINDRRSELRSKLMAG